MEPTQSTRIMVLGCFFVTMAPTVMFHGIGRHTVHKLRQFDLFAVAAFDPTVIILEIGSNDLTDTDTNVPDLAANIFQLVQFLHFNSYISTYYGKPNFDTGKGVPFIPSLQCLSSTAEPFVVLSLETSLSLHFGSTSPSFSLGKTFSFPTASI